MGEVQEISGGETQIESVDADGGVGRGKEQENFPCGIRHESQGRDIAADHPTTGGRAQRCLRPIVDLAPANDTTHTLFGNQQGLPAMGGCTGPDMVGHNQNVSGLDHG